MNKKRGPCPSLIGGLPERYRNKITYGAKSLKIADIRNNHYATINVLIGESGYGGGGGTESFGRIRKNP